MTFLNPSILFALFLVAVPVIIHLLNLRKLRKIEFSSLMLLKEIKKSKIKRIRIKEWLLMVLRMLLIIFLVMSFSNPVVKDINVDSGKSISKTCIIIIDDSYSMERIKDSLTLFEKAKKDAIDITGYYEPNDRVFVVPYSRILMRNERKYFNFVDNISDSVDNLKTSDVSFSMQVAMDYAAGIISKNYSLINEIFILTDNQKGNYSDFKFESIFRGIDSENIFLYVLEYSADFNNNLSLDNLSFRTKIFETGKKVNIDAEIKNYSGAPVSDKSVILYIDGQKISERKISLYPNEYKKVNFEFTPERKGRIYGYIELKRDAANEDVLANDNCIYFTFNIPENINVGIIGRDKKYINYLIESAGSFMSQDNRGNQTVISLKEYSSVTDNIFNNDMIILSGYTGIGEKESEILQNYYNSGLNILIFPAFETDLISCNKFLSEISDIELTGKIGISENEKIRFDFVDFSHPLFSGIFEKHKVDNLNDNFLGNLLIKYYYKLSTHGSRNILSFDGGKLFLAETVGSPGKMLIFSVSSSLEMSNFPQTELFPVLIFRIINYLSGNNEPQSDDIIGKTNFIPVNNKKYMYVENPDKIKLQFDYLFDTVAYKEKTKNILLAVPFSEYFKKQGIYAVNDENSKLNEFFALNATRKESNPEVFDMKDLSENFKKSDIKTFISNDKNEIKNRVYETREGTGLWKIFLIIALIILMIIYFVEKRIEKGTVADLY